MPYVLLAPVLLLLGRLLNSEASPSAEGEPPSLSADLARYSSGMRSCESLFVCSIGLIVELSMVN